MILFAEGTRSNDGKLGSFKKGAFQMAKQAGVRIVPVSIGNYLFFYNFISFTCEISIFRKYFYSFTYEFYFFCPWKIPFIWYITLLGNLHRWMPKNAALPIAPLRYFSNDLHMKFPCFNSLSYWFSYVNSTGISIRCSYVR